MCKLTEKLFSLAEKKVNMDGWKAYHFEEIFNGFIVHGCTENKNNQHKVFIADPHKKNVLHQITVFDVID